MHMKILTVGDFKRHCSEVIERVRAGEKDIISDGKQRESVAVLTSSATYRTKKLRLGLLQDESFEVRDDFKMTEEELVSS